MSEEAIEVGDLVRADIENNGRTTFATVTEWPAHPFDKAVIEIHMLSKRQLSVSKEKLVRVDRSAVYRDAIFAVDPGACNLSGLVHSLKRHMDYIWHEAKEKGQGTAAVNRHPAVVLFVSQMVYLATGNCLDTDAYAAAEGVCRSYVAEADTKKAGEAVVSAA